MHSTIEAQAGVGLGDTHWLEAHTVPQTNDRSAHRAKPEWFSWDRQGGSGSSSTPICAWPTPTGRWQAIERLKETRPYLRYVAVRDERTRPKRRSWHGTVLPVDHPWWNTRYPPNGWNCRCIVQQLSGDDLERYGYTPTSGPGPDADVTMPWLNKRTGEITRIPVGVDPGFAHNVGELDLASACPERDGQP